MAVIHELTLIDAINASPVAGATVRVETGDLSAEFISDVRGIARIEMAESPRHVGIHVTRNGYVPKLIAWDLGTLRIPWPDRYELKMERAHTIGGFVRNQRGEPVERATVLVTLRGATPQGAQPRVHNEIWEQEATTDADGRWQYDKAPRDFDYISVRLAHPDYVSNQHIDTLPSCDEFKAGTAVLTATHGIPCEGIVTDESSQPLAGVKVILGEGAEDSTTKPSRRTDAQGRFRFGGVAPRSGYMGVLPVLSFNKDGFGPEMIQLQPATPVIQVNVMLRPGRPLRMRVVDPEGVPLEGVRVSMSNWRGHRPFHRYFLTDADGRAEWEHAPSDPMRFWVLKEGFQRLEVTLQAGADVHTVTLKRPGKISGHVVDARTKQPIPKFSLILGRHFPAPREATHWNYAWVYPFEDGKLQVGIGEPVILRNHDGSVAEVGFRCIRVSAHSYRAAISRLIANDETEVVCDFELELEEGLRGVVRDGRGHAVAGADIAAVPKRKSTSVIVENGKIHHRDYFTTTTDDEGRYELPAQEENFTILVSHPAAGYALTSCEELKTSPDVRLQPWGRLELRTTSVKDASYQLQPPYDRDAPHHIRYLNKPTIANEETLIFENLPAGPMRWAMSGQPIYPENEVQIASGETAILDLRTGRRIVIGRIMLPAEGIVTEGRLVQLRLRCTPPADEALFNRPRYQEIHFRIDFEGRFRICDVLPGHYKLTALFFRNLPNQASRTQDVAGYALKEFELLPGEGEHDLGDLPWRTPDDGT